MSIPYVSPEQRRREHEEILAFIAKEKAEKEQQTEADRDEPDDWFENLSFDDLPDFMKPRPKPEESLKASDFTDKSCSPFTKNNNHFQININHPAIRPVYEQYVQEECRTPAPISEHQRLMFEMRVIQKLDSLKIFKEDYEQPITDEEIRETNLKNYLEREKREDFARKREIFGR